MGHRTKKVCDLFEELFVSGFTPYESFDGNIPKKLRTLKEVNKEKYSSYKFSKTNAVKMEGNDSKGYDSNEPPSVSAVPDRSSNTA